MVIWKNSIGNNVSSHVLHLQFLKLKLDTVTHQFSVHWQNRTTKSTRQKSPPQFQICFSILLREISTFACVCESGCVACACIDTSMHLSYACLQTTHHMSQINVKASSKCETHCWLSIPGKSHINFINNNCERHVKMNAVFKTPARSHVPAAVSVMRLPISKVPKL